MRLCCASLCANACVTTCVSVCWTCFTVRRCMPTVRSYHACDFALMHCVSIYPTPNERRLTQRAALQRATHDWNLRCNVIKRASYTAQHTVRVMQRATSVVPSRTGAPMNARTSLARIDLGACERPVSPKRSRDGKFPETFRKLSGSLQKACRKPAVRKLRFLASFARAQVGQCGLHRPLEDKLELAQIGRMRAKYPDLVIG